MAGSACTSIRSIWNCDEEIILSEPDDFEEACSFINEKRIWNSSNFEDSDDENEETKPKLDQNDDMVKALKDMYRHNSDLCDVTFLLKHKDGQDVCLSAHRLVLTMWSLYFRNAFYSSCKNIENIINEGVITLTDVNPVAFKWVLDFMYDIVDSPESCKDALEIYKVAERFEVNYIMEIMKNFVNCLSPTIKNVLEIFEATTYMNLPVKHKKCLNFIQQKTDAVFTVNNMFISKTALKEILSLDELHFESEYELLVHVFRWSKMYSLGNNLDNCRDALEDFLPNLYFLSLTHEEFTNILAAHEDFFIGNEALSIHMNISVFKSKPLPEWLRLKKRKFTKTKDTMM